MVPCGIQSVTMTSIVQEIGRDVAMGEVEEQVAKAFGIVFDLRPKSLASDALDAAAAQFASR
jgi:lipoate-protein ligase B